MGKYIVELSSKAKKEIRKIYQSGNINNNKKLEIIFKELAENPRIGIGNPEQLKYQKSEIWSRRINKKDRIIYQISEDIILVLVIQLLGHYDDK